VPGICTCCSAGTGARVADNCFLATMPTMASTTTSPTNPNNPRMPVLPIRD